MKSRSSDKKALATMGAVTLGMALLSFWFVDRDWYSERAYALSMAGRGQYR